MSDDNEQACDPWEGVPFDPAPNLPGFEGGWAHPELRRRLAEMKHQLAELQQELRHAREDAHAARGVAVEALTGAGTVELIQALRANGVTKYEAGDVKIELAPPMAHDVWEAETQRRLHSQAPPTCMADKPSIDHGKRLDQQPPLDEGIPDDGPPEPEEHLSGFGVDRAALAERLAELDRRRGTAG